MWRVCDCRQRGFIQCVKKRKKWIIRRKTEFNLGRGILKKKESEEHLFQKAYKGLFVSRNNASDAIRNVEGTITIEESKVKEVNDTMNNFSIKRAKVVAELEGLNKEFEEFAYIDARKAYLKVAKEGYQSEDLLKRLADSYYYTADYNQAAKWYGVLYDTGNKEADYLIGFFITVKTHVWKSTHNIKQFIFLHLFT